jgi:outer membrane protein assembly factor BamB
MSLAKIPLISLVALFGGLVSAAERDWPQFRGPHRDDVSPDKGLLQEWPKDGPPLAWKATGIGGGYSSVAVAGDRLYTMGNKGPKSYVFAVDRGTGKVLWSVEVGAEGGNLGCTPTVDGDRVYAVGQHGDLVCIDAAKATVTWRTNFKKNFGGNCGGWNYTESPLVDGEKLIATPGAKDATLVAFNKITGEVIWKCAAPVSDPTAGYASVVIADAGGIKQYVQLIAGGVIGVRATDGKFLWKYDKLGNNTANIPTPIVLGDKIFCSAGYGKGGALLQLEATGDRVTAKELYYKPALKNKHGGLVVVGDYLYGDHDDSGHPFCADVKTGKVMWRKESGPGGGSAAVTFADGRLYVRYDNGVMALVDPAPSAYREISTFKPPKGGSPSWAHPVVIGGRMYLREQDTILCYDVMAR